MSTTTTLTDAQLVDLPADDLRRLAALELPHLSSAALAAIPDDSLVVDLLHARWTRDRDLLPAGYWLGHANPYDDDAEAEYTTTFVQQIAASHRRHVASFHARDLERAIERANQVAKAAFVATLQRIVDDSAGDDVRLVDVATDPGTVSIANDAAKTAAQTIMEQYTARRDAELRAAAIQADALVSSAPDVAGKAGSSRHVLLDLLHETYDDVERCWTSCIVYHWTTGDDLRSDGAGIVKQLRSALDDLEADSERVGRLRTAVL
jgi:hypothetical protein